MPIVYCTLKIDRQARCCFWKIFYLSIFARRDRKGMLQKNLSKKLESVRFLLRLAINYGKVFKRYLMRYMGTY